MMCNNRDCERTIEGLFKDALFELITCYLGDHEVVIRPHSVKRESDITAIVGLGDQQMSASVSLTTTTEDATVLAGSITTDPIDWIGELGNQLAGRLKNKLNVFGLQPRLSTPTIVKGQQIEVRSGASSQYSLWVHSEEISVLAQMILKVEPSLSLIPQESAESMIEGEIALF